MSDYAPYRAGVSRLAMGLVPLDLRDWMQPDAHLAIELGEKDRLLRERHHEVFAALPEAADGAQEVLELLAAHLPERFPALYRRQGQWLDNLVTGQRWDLYPSALHPLDVAGRLVQEDLCLMQGVPDDHTYRLVAASVCFPTRWRLADKMGQPLGAIHAPVPGYEEQLAASMDRFFQRLKTDRPVWRINWSLLDDSTLFQPKGHGRRAHNPHITTENAGDTVWLRMERQTLRRLPRSAAILFTIRVYVHPLRELAAYPEHAAALATAMRALPAPILQYKSFYPFMDAVLAWLDCVSLRSVSSSPC